MTSLYHNHNCLTQNLFRNVSNWIDLLYLKKKKAKCKVSITHLLGEH